MSFAGKTLTSTIWAFSTGYANIFIAFLGNLFLARILLPEDFGIFAMASAVLVFITMFTGFGSQEAILQCRDENIEGLIPTAFWLSIAIAIMVSVAGIITGFVARYYYGKIVGLMIVSLSLLVPFTSVSNAHSSLLRREMIYKPVALARMASVTISFGIGVIAALIGFGPWALLVRHGSEAIIYWLGMEVASKYRLQLIFNRKAARWIWDFGWKKMLTQISDVVFGRYDNLLIGIFIGNTQLGYYNQSFRLALLGQQFSQGAISPILLPMFATLQFSPDKLRYGFERVYYWLLRAVPLLGLIIFLCGERAVIMLYGEKWTMTGRYFEAMFIFFIFLPVGDVLKEFLTGAGKINYVVKIRILQLAFFIVGVTAGALLKNMQIIIWFVNLNQVLAALLMGYIANKLITINWRGLLTVPFLAFLIATLGGLLVVPLLPQTSTGLIVSILFLVLLYTIPILIIDRRALCNEIRIIWAASRG